MEIPKLLGGGVEVLLLELKVTLFAICSSDDSLRLQKWQWSLFKIASKDISNALLWFLCPHYSGRTINQEAPRDDKRYAKVPSQQMVPLLKGRTAACRLGSKVSGVLPQRTWEWWGTKAIWKSKSPPSCFACHQKEEKLCHGNYAMYFSPPLCLVQLILTVSFGALH